MTETHKKKDDHKEITEKKSHGPAKAPSQVRNGKNWEKEARALKQEVHDLKEEKARYHDKLARVMADFENYKKRMDEDRSRWMKLANADMARSILPVLDNLELALESIRKREEESAKTLLQGLELVVKQFYDVLKQNGVEVIESKGKPFDPAFHEAMMSEESEDQEEEEIVSEEFQKGYLLYGTVIRPARVKVSKRLNKE
ncbi:MAG TPA: nucleotide exchange factor GrpE [Candidatus Mcinerneyibacteriales bacterium]|nr:nucleotide exchange factor GrpE [Candidatus Mcinerneyibacteriales bacterium]HPE20568.1 nucleotide exchange factor GrpE [Candidatus Mcinerneyibacteriales bacterium]